jgi:hypothetical protein
VGVKVPKKNLHFWILPKNLGVARAVGAKVPKVQKNPTCINIIRGFSMYVYRCIQSFCTFDTFVSATPINIEFFARIQKCRFFFGFANTRGY